MVRFVTIIRVFPVKIAINVISTQLNISVGLMNVTARTVQVMSLLDEER